ncbi:MAG: hypothetical protein KBG15_20925 [Kofleriaceae bacterium]|nr:hypothetical protein [Kofleriaceae bacterium]
MVVARRWLAAVLATSALGLAGCATRRTGPADDPRATLLVELASNPRDSAVHLRLARFELAAQHRAAAMRHFALVEAIGGLFGAKWSVADRRAYAMLLRDRGLFRLSHGQASAAQDFAHAANLGVPVSSPQRHAAAILQAIADVRHAADDIRTRGVRALCRLTATTGACANASALDRVAFATWLWQHRAKRASYDVLVEVSQRSGALPQPARTLWLDAQAWWTGEVLPLPPLVQATRCDAEAAARYVQPRRHDASDDMPGRAQRALDGWRARNGLAKLPPLDDQACRAAADLDLRAPHSPESNMAPPVAGDFIAIFAQRWQLSATDLQALQRVRDTAMPTLDRAVEQALNQSLDEAWTAAALGEFMLVTGDPARARALWQRAFDATGAPRYLQGLAVAAAAVGDSDAATIWATQAAAASGDPASLLAEVAGAMAESGDYPVALTLLRQALAIAGATDAYAIERQISDCLQKLGRAVPAGVPAATWAEIQTAQGWSRDVMLDLDAPAARAMFAAMPPLARAAAR